ncbi:MAG TPA: Crp/Fnr family transcriptional regulator [Chitinophaga sp.]|uniref:Crp/Fnr family transcriptional regulator n=1 Tax=Chitinophaga sp. TaxID=1869181 RepID=UPI002BE230B0|nr:Crp/Fnr family transcriptional regulator [Chitinophaga sp.]HVI47265.1 Crp/Fnr family transcriptional regulator [Chitinophaga sp.]
MQPIIAHLKRYIPLSGEEEAIFLGAVRTRRIRKKQLLLPEGDVCRQQWYVQSGCLYGYDLNEKGGMHIIKFAVEDQWIGDMHSFLCETPSLMNIEAAEASVVIEISKPSLDELYTKIPQLERFGRLNMESAFIAMQNRMLAAISQTAEERYAAFAQQFPELDQRLPQYMIASYLGITAEFLSKIRKKLSSIS